MSSCVRSFTVYVRSFIVLAAFLPNVLLALDQPGAPVGHASPQSIRLNVHVAPKKGEETLGLQSQDFTVLDNHVARPIYSFKTVTANQEPAKVILLIDGVNTRYSRVSYVSQQVQDFLKTNHGQLEYPTTVAILTDRGVVIQKNFTSDGNALSSSISHYMISLREITRDTGIWGANERMNISLGAFQQLTEFASSIPGRKILLWVSPGWPMISGPRVFPSSKQLDYIFTSIVTFSNEIQQSNLTLYSINPIGVAEGLSREDYYRSFVKGVSAPYQADLGDLSLQVLAIQSGGLALNGSNDVVAGLKSCVADLHSWYEITIPVAKASHPNEYHQIKIKTDKHNLVTRTRDGYYAQP